MTRYPSGSVSSWPSKTLVFGRKGWLARERDGKAYRYKAVASREEYSARLMREAMAGAGDTEAVLSHFVAQMDGSESAALRAVLAKLAGGRP